MVRVRQHNTSYSKVSQKKAKKEAEVVATNEKKAKKLVKLQQLLASTSTMSKTVRLRAVFSMRPIPPKPTTLVQCPECENNLTAQDVQKGFLSDPYKFTTQCPMCKHRFITASVFEVGAQKDRVVWLCEEQTMQAFSDWYGANMDDFDEDSLLEQLVLKQPTIIWNMMRYANEHKVTILGWLKMRFPDIQINRDEQFYCAQVEEKKEAEEEEEDEE